jgi:hypothetical protein
MSNPKKETFRRLIYIDLSYPTESPHGRKSYDKKGRAGVLESMKKAVSWGRHGVPRIGSRK